MCCVFTGASGNENVSAPAWVELHRYLGPWYELARYDGRIEPGCEGGILAA